MPPVRDDPSTPPSAAHPEAPESRPRSAPPDAAGVLWRPVVAIVGGGFAGTSTAVQLVRASRVPLQVVVIDPAEQPGAGLAHGTADPDHRLNAPSFVHTVLPDEVNHFSRWLRAQGELEADPGALEPDGTVYARRQRFGHYLQAMLRAHSGGGIAGAEAAGRARTDPDGHPDGIHLGHAGSRITHRRGRATALTRGAAGRLWRLQIHGPDGLPERLDADAVVLAGGHGSAGLPGPLADAALADHPALVADPWAGDTAARLAALPPDARIMVLGNGLTALDWISTALRECPTALIHVLSRRNVPPQPQGPWPEALRAALAARPGLEAVCDLPPRLLLDRIDAEPPAFIRAAAPTARSWLHALRQAAAEAEAAASGETWHAPFDALRDTLAQTWPALPAAERRRLLARVRPWYDVHRYRTPPMNERAVAAAVARGQVRHHRGRLHAARPLDARACRLSLHWPGAPDAGDPAASRSLEVDLLINCTGTDAAHALSRDQLVARALREGLLRTDASGHGLAVDAQARAVDAAGRPTARLRIVGPATVGAIGAPIGAIYVAAQIGRMVPDLLAHLPDRAVSPES